MTFTDNETKKLIGEYHTIQCVHCQLTWQFIPNSGRVRGWCFYCQGNVCGARLCVQECVPAEAQLEIMEGNPKTCMKYKHTETFRFLTGQQQKIDALVREIEKKFGKGLIF